MLDNLYTGFSIALTPPNLLLCFLGVLTGTLVGVLPGIGPLASISMLMPVTFSMHPASAIIMLAGIYYGAMYGGSTTSILVNMPGEAASVVTSLDGYQMARAGRAGPALGIAAFGSFIAGTFGVVILMLLAPPLASFALKMGPPEYFSMLLFGIFVLVYLAHGSMVKGLIMGVLGLVLGSIGTDIVSGGPRFCFGVPDLRDGVGLLPVAMGLFGVSEVLIQLEETAHAEVLKTSLKQILPNLNDWKESILPILRGSTLGFLLGILPGGGAVISSFASYTLEKKISKHPEKFGKGAIQGVAGPESANNSATAASFVPLMTLGIPSNAVMALMLGALLIHGIRPGPLLLKDNPDIFWGVVTSMYIGNIMLLILNLPLIGIWVKVLKVPFAYLFPTILLLCLIGVYTEKYSYFDGGLLIFFGAMGYLLRKFDFEPAPLILAMILGPMFEDALRQSMIIHDGDIFVFITRPISAVFLSMSLILIVSSILSWFKRRARIFSEESIEKKDKEFAP